MIDDVLIVGYGNALRGDDGLGWHAAERLATHPGLAGARVLQRHQLTPELALDVSRAAYVVFVDAGRGPAGAIAVSPVDRAPRRAPAWTHHVDPAVLLALARELYGRAPDATAVSIGVASVDAGEHLTPLVASRLPAVVSTVIGLIERRGGQRVDA